MKLRALALIASTFALTGCDAINALLNLVDVSVLGVIPYPGFSDPGSADYGKVLLALGGQDDLGGYVAPLLDLIEISSDQSDVTIEDSTTHEGYASGSFVMLLDGSGSLTDTDPQRQRVEAVKLLAQELHACGPDWAISLMEFSNGASSNGFTDTHVLADFTTDTQAVIDAADGLGASGGTPLWDATHEVLAALNGDASSRFIDGGDDFGAGLVVMSDGEDSGTSVGTQGVISKALSHGIAVNNLGFGPASDLDGASSLGAVEDLREVSAATDGFYGFVGTVDDLPALATQIAGSFCGGYSGLVVQYEDPPASGELVSGSVGVRGTDTQTDYGFVAP
jgi:hypothetical protein